MNHQDTIEVGRVRSVCVCVFGAVWRLMSVLCLCCCVVFVCARPVFSLYLVLVSLFHPSQTRNKDSTPRTYRHASCAEKMSPQSGLYRHHARISKPYNQSANTTKDTPTHGQPIRQVPLFWLCQQPSDLFLEKIGAHKHTCYDITPTIMHKFRLCFTPCVIVAIHLNRLHDLSILQCLRFPLLVRWNQCGT